MATWIVLLTLIVPRPAEAIVATSVAGVERPDVGPMRYRGLDQLLAKFDREWVAPPRPDDQKR